MCRLVGLFTLSFDDCRDIVAGIQRLHRTHSFGAIEIWILLSHRTRRPRSSDGRARRPSDGCDDRVGWWGWAGWLDNYNLLLHKLDVLLVVQHLAAVHTILASLPAVQGLLSAIH